MSFLLVSAPQCVLSGGFGHRAWMALALERPHSSGSSGFTWSFGGFRTALGVWREKSAHLVWSRGERGEHACVCMWRLRVYSIHPVDALYKPSVVSKNLFFCLNLRWNKSERKCEEWGELLICDCAYGNKYFFAVVLSSSRLGAGCVLIWGPVRRAGLQRARGSVRSSRCYQLLSSRPTLVSPRGHYRLRIYWNPRRAGLTL